VVLHGAIITPVQMLNGEKKEPITRGTIKSLSSQGKSGMA
jgi:hypothetical protein